MREVETKSASEIEVKLEKINKLISDNAVLNEKLNESDKLRRKYQERHAYQEEKIKSLIEKSQALDESVGSLRKQLTDAKSLKSYNHKIYEEKISVLNEQVDKLKKENSKLKKNTTGSPNASSKVNYEENDEPTLEPVQAKPFLFGPVDTGKY